VFIVAKGKKVDSQRITWSRPYKLPQPLEKDAETTLQDHPEQGYTGLAEFVRDAVREKIERIKTPPQEVAAQ
jgi:hypothetical protein